MRGVFDSVAEPLRPDERSHVGRPAPALEALHRADRRRARRRAGARPCRRHRRSRAAVRPGGRADRPRRAVPTSTTRCSRKAATSCSTAASRCRSCSATPRRCRSPTRSFDAVSIGFGLRNVTRKEAALAEMRRVLKPGGVALVLEFSRVWAPLAPGLRLVQLQRAAPDRAPGGEGRRELPLPRRVDPHAPGPGIAEVDDGTGGLRPGRIPQPCRRRGLAVHVGRVFSANRRRKRMKRSRHPRHGRARRRHDDRGRNRRRQTLGRRPQPRRAAPGHTPARGAVVARGRTQRCRVQPGDARAARRRRSHEGRPRRGRRGGENRGMSRWLGPVAGIAAGLGLAALAVAPRHRRGNDEPHRRRC